MRSKLLLASMMAIVASAGIASEVIESIPKPRYRPQPRSKMTPEQRSEVQAWNDAVQAKRDAKLARKGKRK